MSLMKHFGNRSRVPPTGEHKAFGKSTAGPGPATTTVAKISRRRGYSPGGGRRGGHKYNAPTKGGKY